MSFNALHALNVELSTQLIRIITGRILTDEQIKRITSHYIGRHFADLFPTPETERQARERITEAKNHIENASRIMSDLRLELDAQNETLNRLMEEIDQNKKVADHYRKAASVNEDSFSALKNQMEAGLRSELQRQSQEGKKLRQFVSFIFWSFTLVAGAAAGHYFKDILDWTSALLR